MKKILAVSAALAALNVSAFAADMPVKAPAAQVEPMFNWTGFYVGGDVGGVWAKDRIIDADGLNVPQSYSLKSSGVIGGGILGYNVQSGQFVYGLEADLGGMGISKTIGEPHSGTPPVTTNHLGAGFYGDVTGRLGLAFNRTLAYVKGGWAFYDADANVNNTGVFGGGIATTGKFTGGWAIGGGLEFAFAPGWSAKVEYMHFDFGTERATLVTPFNGNFLFPNKLTADAATLGLIYHFAR